MNHDSLCKEDDKLINDVFGSLEGEESRGEGGMERRGELSREGEEREVVL